MFTETVNWPPTGPEKVGAETGHVVEEAESMQTVPTMAPRTGCEANGIARREAKTKIDAYTIFFKKSHLSFRKKGLSYSI